MEVNLMADILFIQPWDKPWLDQRFILDRKKMYLPRALFEVGYQVPLQYSFSSLNLNFALKAGFLLEEAIIRTLENEKPRIVFLSMPTFAQGGQVGKIVKAIKKVSSRIKVILGGNAVALVRGAPFSWWDVDLCYDGFGVEIPAMLEALYGGCQQPIAGVLWRNVGTGLRGEPKLVDGYQAESLYTFQGRQPFFDQLQSARDAGVEPMGVIEMTRGCSFKCGFCALNAERLGFFQRMPKTVLGEARFLFEHGVTYLHLIDPTLGLGEGARELLDGLQALAQRFPQMRVEVLTRAELVTYEFAKALRAANVCRVGIGMESMTVDSLRGVGKTLAPSRTEQAVAKLAEHGIETKLFHIMFPGTFSETTIQFLLRLHYERAPFILQSSFLRVLPNPKSPPQFFEQDQTSFVRGKDTPEQLVEWAFANLAFKSMDIGGNGDEALVGAMQEALNRGKPLTSLRQWKKRGKELWVFGGSRRYVVALRPSWPLAASVFEG